jgi:hypothetical protein
MCPQAVSRDVYGHLTQADSPLNVGMFASHHVITYGLQGQMLSNSITSDESGEDKIENAKIDVSKKACMLCVGMNVDSCIGICDGAVTLPSIASRLREINGLIIKLPRTFYYPSHRTKHQVLTLTSLHYNSISQWLPDFCAPFVRLRLPRDQCRNNAELQV